MGVLALLAARVGARAVLVWGIGTAIEIGMPLFSRRRIETIRIHVSHIPDGWGSSP